jgi:hypothetical protein
MHTFTSAAKLDIDLLVHVLAQVKNVFLLWPLSLCRCPSTLCAATPTTAATAIASSSTAATASECASFGHVDGFGIGNGRLCRRAYFAVSDVRNREKLSC